MSVKKQLKSIFEKLTGTNLFTRLPFGLVPSVDIKRKFPDFNPETVFDVGANIGQTAVELVKQYPQAKIFCFEPSQSTAEILKNNVRAFSNVSVHTIALGNNPGNSFLLHSDSSDKNRLLTQTESVTEFTSEKVEKINVDTLSGFCRSNNIKHIGYLKIDTEGFDLEVIKSGYELLQSFAIDFIEVEVGMNGENKLHVPFEEVKLYMEKAGYFLFGIYEQVHEWKEKKPFLRRTNSVYISGSLIAAYQRSHKK